MISTTIRTHPLSLALLLFSAMLATSTFTAAQTAEPAAPRAQAAELERKAAELKEAGRHDEARLLMQRVEELRAEGRRNREAIADRPRQPRPERQARGLRDQAEPRPDLGEIERRIHHLEVAIDNLHAAGMPDPAERLTRELEQMRRHLAEMTPGRPARPEVPVEAIEELRAQMGELHRIVRQLRAEIEELRRERR